MGRRGKQKEKKKIFSIQILKDPTQSIWECHSWKRF